VIGTGGSISSHVVLQPQLEGQNHIIKPLWLPGSQTQLALLSADAVKIYDLGKDAISPKYYFLLPSGKVRDATFVVQVRFFLMNGTRERSLNSSNFDKCLFAYSGGHVLHRNHFE